MFSQVEFCGRSRTVLIVDIYGLDNLVIETPDKLEKIGDDTPLKIGISGFSCGLEKTCFTSLRTVTDVMLKGEQMSNGHYTVTHTVTKNTTNMAILFSQQDHND